MREGVGTIASRSERRMIANVAEWLNWSLERCDRTSVQVANFDWAIRATRARTRVGRVGVRVRVEVAMPHPPQNHSAFIPFSTSSRNGTREAGRAELQAPRRASPGRNSARARRQRCARPLPNRPGMRGPELAAGRDVSPLGSRLCRKTR